jgi:hypothetical protein
VDGGAGLKLSGNLKKGKTRDRPSRSMQSRQVEMMHLTGVSISAMLSPWNDAAMPRRVFGVSFFDGR